MGAADRAQHAFQRLHAQLELHPVGLLVNQTAQLRGVRLQRAQVVGIEPVPPVVVNLFGELEPLVGADVVVCL